eukprot:TRINITY_DN1915_c0_g2_i8.p1 TRINITY_DN1915_c0_g2~~TRINITY_DN1915_c0_g2_i8.p1  ORF type:complete len:337 (+),score=31.61 TRINITY_DN1915_c0_g2_i8:34-1011(+)
MEVHFEQTTRRRRQAGQPLSEATTDVHSEQTTRRRRQAGQTDSHYQKLPWRYTRNKLLDVEDKPASHYRKLQRMYTRNKLLGVEDKTDSHYQKLPWRYTRNKLLDVEDKPASHYRKLQRMYTRNKLLGVEDKTDSHYRTKGILRQSKSNPQPRHPITTILKMGQKNSHVDRPSTISQPLSQEPLLGPESTEECSQNPRQNEDDQHDASDQPVVQDETEENATQEDDQRDASDQPVYMSVSEAVAKFLKDDRKILTKPSSRSRQRWNQQTTREQKKKHFTLCMIQRARRDLINARQGQAMYKGRLHCGYLQNVIETLVRTEYLDFI